MIQITCPNCGLRNVQEFRYGGELTKRPPQPLETTAEAWTDYLYMRANRQGIQTEWWYHWHGCGLWFLAERHTRSNEVVRTFRWQAGTPAAEET